MDDMLRLKHQFQALADELRREKFPTEWQKIEAAYLRGVTDARKSDDAVAHRMLDMFEQP